MTNLEFFEVIKKNMKEYFLSNGYTICKIYKGTCVANIGGNHTVCIKNGKVHDTWDSTDGCIGNYWVKAD